MKGQLLLIASFILFSTVIKSQEFDQSPSIGISTGMVNYEGDLKPNSFTFDHSNFFAGVHFHKPVNRWLSLRAGVNMGRVEGADRFNRDYLKARNLSFYSRVNEFYAGFEFSLLDISTKRVTPYFYAGIGLFHFDPWTYDNQNQKTRLQPLSTEGQGLSAYPEQKRYALTQLMFPFGGGLKYAVTDCFRLGLEFSQRKTFTDYLDDVSTHYVDENILLQGRGAKAVELAFRGDELQNGGSYPHTGEQRGTPGEKDWYYFLGITAEIKFDCFQNLLSNHSWGVEQCKCPRF